MGRTSVMWMGFAGVVCAAAGVIAQPGSGGSPCYGIVCGTSSANPECTWAQVCTETYCWLTSLGGFSTYNCPDMTRTCKICDAEWINGACVIDDESCTTEQEMDAPMCT